MSTRQGVKCHFGVKCPQCNKRMFSFYVNDYKECGCPNKTMVDGGKCYLRYGWIGTRPKRIRFTERLDGPFPPLPKSEEVGRWPY